MSLTKAGLRKAYFSKRAELGLQDMHRLSAHMLAHLEQIVLPEGNVLLSYKPIAKRNEVPVQFFEEALIEINNHLQVCYPRTQMADNSMEAILETDDTEWKLSQYGVEEPQNGPIVQPAEIDIVFVPLLAFDQRGYRVGYGKGFYDRFLQRCRPDIISIGLSWYEPVQAIEDINANDVPLKYCITPHTLYAF
ncbi:MAG TPA: 5-formyltetrahydrofolate cyclo-ligase [Phnomibacter sp.]|nr:5-formyltetrahydrofolate cyclo-ligase [Phnomibacter sp.]